MTNEEPLPKKVRLSETDFKVMARDELVLRWKQYEAYVQALEGKYTDLNSNDQQQESARRENILVMRLATKEQEMQECTTQIQYLKQVQQPSVAQLRSTMVDPAINLLFLKMKSELEQTNWKDKLEQAQNELSAWKFKPDSQTGKKLMAKWRMLIQENQELGRQLSQGRIVQLEADQDELNDFIIQLDEEVEGMQSTILVLQQQLKETRQQLAQYQQQQSQAPARAPAGLRLLRQRTSGSGFHREGDTVEDDFPPSPGNGNKASSSSEERTGRGSSYVNQLSAGYESVDSPTGNSNHDPQEEKTVSGKGNRTAGSRHVQNGLDSSVNVQSSVLLKKKNFQQMFIQCHLIWKRILSS
ncbi:hypothetical protein FD754_015177 [Muntiacus muntjak]|uniref:Pre-mRNA-splicing regulator WTAP n=1 Tax=Muntiacus muntjak TaxID=9888 RepID=A0A5N3VLW9_MUNMU|nr:hypothetical protein FD754_015177 [Muntiacus muntjak]